MLKNEILKKIDALFVYSATMTDKTKARYISHLEKIKEEIAVSLSNATINPEGKMVAAAPVVHTPAAKSAEKTGTGPKKQAASSREPVTRPQSLTSLAGALIPRLTQKGKKKIDDLSTPIHLYTMLKLIDEKTSLWELHYLYSYKYKTFLEFLNICLELETNKLINFIKSENLVAEVGWIKLGELLIEAGVIHEINVTNAANYKRTSKGMLLGQAIVELKFLTEETINQGLELQKWLAEMVKKSIFIEGLITTDKSKSKTVSENASDILDFIIPVFNDNGKVFLSGNNDKNFTAKLVAIDEKSSLLKIYEKFSAQYTDKLDFFDFILKLDSQELLTYKKNEETEARDTWIRFGELAVTLGLIKTAEIDESIAYRHKNSHRKIFIGEALVELNHMSQDVLDQVLRVQRWCNTILSKISYETALITAIKEVLEVYFKSPTEIGRFRKVSFNKPLPNMVCITYTISGNLNGQVYYIFDKSFVENLTKNLMASYGMDQYQVDESIISEICNILTGSSLTKLSKIGVFCETTIPHINMEPEIVIANKQVISVLPLVNQFGRFIVGFLLKS